MSIKRFRRLMKKSWYRRRIKKLAVIWALIIIFASAALSMLPGKKADAVGEDQNVYYKYYDNVRIEKGDTLWGYAEEFKSPDGMSYSEYINDVKRINHLNSDKLVVGQTIVLPYYSMEYICSR
ncbi:MAG: LysM peptidoglycan-binding domain-containing protein [Lachnospiraceae bacterium]|nr:LysM peptidoglycan-binding domain-containing protein [Lachnospiraceae bacterium]